MEWVGLHVGRRAVVLGKPGMLLDLGGMAKGYAADRMLEVLVAGGYPAAIVVAGGDVRAGAAPPGADGWEVALRPFGDRDGCGEPLRLSIESCAVSTSGSVHRFVEIDGRRYSHIVDPATGVGIDPGLACTVIARHGRLSDPLATAFCVLGVERGLVLAGDLGVDVLFAVVGDGGRGGGGRGVSLVGSPGFPTGRTDGG